MIKDKSTLIPLVIIGLCALVAGGAVAWKFLRPHHPFYLDTGYHVHADFKVYLNGKAVDFSLAKYQSTEEKHLDDYTHLHDGDGEVMHFHKPSTTIGYFFKTLGMEFTKDCFILDSGEKFCTTPTSTLELWVNGKKNILMDEYVITDLDRILITYGLPTDEERKKELESVTDKACISSEKCPERGKAKKESCVVGEPCR